MKQTVQPDANHALNSAEPVRGGPAQRQTVVAGSPLAQLASMVNQSPLVQTQLKLSQELCTSGQVARQQALASGLADEINQSAPAQLCGRAVDDSHEHAALYPFVPSRLSPLFSTLLPVQRVLGYHVVTSAPEPEARQESEGSDDEDPVPEVRLRKAPDGEYKGVYFQVGRGLTVTEENGEWAKVRSGKQTGWMRSEFLTRQPNPANERNMSWEQASGQPFGSDNSDPALEDVRQGNLNNCFFLAPLAAIAHAPGGPALIRKILVDLGLGKYRVGFYEVTDENEVNDQPEQVTVDNWFPSDAKGAFLYSPAGESLEEEDFPTWSAIVEKAYAWWGSEEHEEGKKQGYAASQSEVASVALANLVGLVPRSLSWNVESPETRTLEGVHDTSTLWHQNAITEGEDEDKEDFKPESVKNISSNALFKALHDLRGDRNNVLVAESNNGENDHDKYLNPEDPEDLRIRGGHVYVITSVYKHTVRLWDPITQERTRRMPIGKFKTLFNRVLTANIGESPAIET